MSEIEYGSPEPLQRLGDTETTGVSPPALQASERVERRSRGILLRSLDRSRVYRIAYVGRRWEVLGPEDAEGASGEADGDSAQARSAEHEAAPLPAGPPAGYPARHSSGTAE